MQQRTEMLAGVSHDLRTPLTRMKLELAMMKENESIQALKGDLEEMEHMLEEYLAFARGQAGEGAVATDLAHLMRDTAANAQRKADAKTPPKTITVNVPAELALEVRPNALRRCVTNLLENAVRHGSVIELNATEGDDAIDIAIEDNGPGIPPERREEAFRPFHRFDSGRSLVTGGAGLEIGRAHV